MTRPAARPTTRRATSSTSRAPRSCGIARPATDLGLRNSGAADPALRIAWHDADTVVIRQGASSHFEAPFLFLLLGRKRALLLDTGATADPEVLPLRATIDHLVESWVEREGLEEPHPLVVAHTHAHDDHVAGDGQFADRPHTTVVGHEAAAVAAFFGLDDGRAEFELGGRTLEVLATPGHDAAAITVFDPATGWLLTGDTVYPGRLYIEDDVAFARSLDTVAAFAREHPVSAVLGGHVEMSTEPGVDYPAGTIEQPDELPLALEPERLEVIRRAAHLAVGRPGRRVLDDVVLVNRTAGAQTPP